MCEIVGSGVMIQSSTTQRSKKMFHLYINGTFYKAYKTRGAAQGAFAKMYAIRHSADWKIFQVAE
jgi:predicted metalloprotease